MQVFAFPFAGGNAWSYRKLTHAPPGNLSLRVFELPGRGTRSAEPLVPSLPLLVEDLLPTVAGAITGPYALFGHSLGALLAFELAHRLSDLGRPPAHVFLSGRQAPSVPNKRLRWKLPDSAFYKVLRDLGCAPEVLANEELMEVYGPVLRADFRAAEEYARAQAAPLDIAMTVLLGDQDDVTAEDAALWQVETIRPLQTHWFAGGHFFLFDQPAEVGRVIREPLGASG